MIAAELAAEAGATLRRHKSRASVAEIRLPGTGGAPGARAIVAVPTSYMNECGGQVAALLSFYSLDSASLVVLHDDLELPFGQVRLKEGGGEGGHNGLRSISRSVRTREYRRVRIGIDRPPGRQDPADYVLSDFSTTQRKELPFIVGDVTEAVLSLAGQA